MKYFYLILEILAIFFMIVGFIVGYDKTYAFGIIGLCLSVATSCFAKIDYLEKKIKMLKNRNK